MRRLRISWFRITTIGIVLLPWLLLAACCVMLVGCATPGEVYERPEKTSMFEGDAIVVYRHELDNYYCATGYAWADGWGSKWRLQCLRSWEVETRARRLF